MGMFIAGGVSGAHLNPAVTLSFAVQGKFALAETDSRTGSPRSPARLSRRPSRIFVYIEALRLYI